MTARQSAQRKRRFLEAFARGGNISAACKATGLDRNAVYRALEHDADFLVRFHAAELEATENLEAHAWAWARDGIPTVKEVWERQPDGELVLVKRELAADMNPTLLMFLLKGRKPETYRERVDVNQNVTQVVKAYAGFNPAEV